MASDERKGWERLTWVYDGVSGEECRKRLRSTTRHSNLRPSRMSRWLEGGGDDLGEESGSTNSQDQLREFRRTKEADNHLVKRVIALARSRAGDRGGAIVAKGRDRGRTAAAVAPFLLVARFREFGHSLVATLDGSEVGVSNITLQARCAKIRLRWKPPNHSRGPGSSVIEESA